MSIKTRKFIKEIFFIMLGNILVAISIAVFFDPQGLVTGGVSGIAIAVSEVSQRLGGKPIPLGLTNMVLNIPLLILSYKILGKEVLGRTVFSIIFLSLALSWAETLPPIEQDLVLSSVFGGVICGAGLGLVIRNHATTGGADLAAGIIHKYFKHISIARILFIIDAVVIGLGFFIFGAKATMYAGIAAFATSKMTDIILEGFDFAKAVFIISDYSDEIGEKIMVDTERGATALYGKGVYTGEEKRVLLVVMNSKEIIEVKDIVQEVDPNAFVIVTDVREVLGEGFQMMS